MALEPGVRAAGVKLVAANEPYFDGHFPGAPVFPGVLLCEALAQLGAAAVGEGDDVALAGVQRARFRRPVLPGDVLELAVTVAGRVRPWPIPRPRRPPASCRRSAPCSGSRCAA